MSPQPHCPKDCTGCCEPRQCPRAAPLQVAQFSAPTPGGGSAECIGVKLPYQGSALFTATLAMPVGALQAGAPLALEGGLPYAEALAACQAAVLGGGAEGNAAAVAWGSPSATVQLYLPR